MPEVVDLGDGLLPAVAPLVQVDGDAKQYIAERPDIMYIDVDRDGWDKMSEF